MTDKRREWNNDMMDPDWTPTPQSAFKEFMNRKKVEYMNTHPGMFGTVHVTDWAEEYLKPLESLVHRQAELLERCKPFIEQLVKDYAESETKAERKILKDLEALGEE